MLNFYKKETDTDAIYSLSVSSISRKDVSTGSEIINDDRVAILEGVKDVTVTKGPEALGGIALKYVRIFLGGNTTFKGNGFSVQAVQSKESGNITTVAFDADQEKLTSKATGSYTAVKNDSSTQPELASFFSSGYKTATVDNIRCCGVFGGDITVKMDGSANLLKNEACGFFLANNTDLLIEVSCNSTGSYQGSNGSRGVFVQGYKDVSVSSGSAIVTAFGGKHDFSLQGLGELDASSGAMDIGMNFAGNYQATGSLTESGNSTVYFAKGYKDAAIADSTNCALNGGDGRMAISADGTLNNEKDGDLYNVSGTIALDMAEANKATGKAALSNATVRAGRGYQTLTANDSAIGQLVGGTFSSAVTGKVTLKEDGLKAVEASKINQNLRELLSAIDIADLSVDFDKIQEILGGKAADFLMDADSINDVTLTIDEKASGRATIAGGSYQALVGYKDVAVSNGTVAGIAIGGKESLVVDAHLETKRTVDEAADTKTITMNDDEGLVLSAQVTAEGTYKAEDSSVRFVAGYKNLAIANNLREIGGEGQDDQGIAIFGGNATLNFQGIPQEGVVTVSGSNGRNASTGVPDVPVSTTGTIGGLTDFSYEATGKAVIVGGKEGTPTHLYNNMSVAGYKDLTIDSNKSQALLLGGNFNIRGTGVVSFDNGTTGGAWDDLRYNKESKSTVLERLAKFAGNETISLSVTGGAGDLSLESTGSLKIQNDSASASAIGYKNVKVTDSTLTAAIGGKMVSNGTTSISVDATFSSGTVSIDWDSFKFAANGLWTSDGKFTADNATVNTIIGYKDVSVKNSTINVAVGGILDYHEKSGESSENDAYELLGSFTADNVKIDDMVAGYKTVNIKNSTIAGGISTRFFKKFDIAGEDYEIKAIADAKGSKVTIQDSVFGSEEQGKTVPARVVMGNTIIMKNVSGSLSSLVSTDYNDKVEITASSLTIDSFGKSSSLPLDDKTGSLDAGNDTAAEPLPESLSESSIFLGAGNDTLKIGNDSNVNVMKKIVFGEGSDTLTVGKNCNVTLKSDAEGLGKFTIGKGTTAYLSSELIDKLSGTSKDVEIIDIGDVDTAINFTTLADEQSDNTLAGARTIEADAGAQASIGAVPVAIMSCEAKKLFPANYFSDASSPSSESAAGTLESGTLIFSEKECGEALFAGTSESPDAQMPNFGDGVALPVPDFGGGSISDLSSLLPVAPTGSYDGWLNDELDTTDFFKVDDWKSVTLTGDEFAIDLWSEDGKIERVLDKSVTFADYEDVTAFAVVLKNSAGSGSYSYSLALA